MKKLFTLLAIAVSFSAIDEVSATPTAHEYNIDNTASYALQTEYSVEAAAAMEYSEAYGRVQAYTTNYYNYGFYAGTTTRVVVDGDGDTDLDLYIYDGYGNLVCCDDDYTDYCVCEWDTIVTGYFSIQVVNRGSVYNDYTITIY